VRFVARSKSQDRAFEAAARLKQIAEPLLPRGADLLGPAECPIALIAGNWRYQLLLRGPDMARLHAAARLLLDGYEAGHDARVYLEVDVDPAALM
jgi:primosomal protein N' (replication factor Y)